MKKYVILFKVGGNNMPATVTHAYFMTDIYDKLPIGLKSLLIDEKKSLRMFGQSMDPLFFYNKVSLKSGKRVQEFGEYFHTHQSQDFFINLVNYIKYNNYYKIPDVMAFLYGLMGHYFLDTTIHPFVFYKTGNFEKDKPETYQYNGKHHEMEVFLDNYFIKQREHISPYKFRFFDYCFDFKPFSAELIDVINYTFHETFGIKNMAKFYQEALHQMYFDLKLFRYDKYGIKHTFYKALDKITPKTSFRFQYISYHLPLSDKHNYLNLNHKIWHHPCQKKEQYKTSITDLYLHALYEANKAIKDVNYYFKDKKNINLKKVFTNLSYHTGKNCLNKKTLKYFEEV